MRCCRESDVIAYLRVSTEEQENSGAGLNAQKATINASQHPVSSWEQDVVSGKSLERPALQRALLACASGEEDGIVVAKLDRLSRSVIDFGQLLERSRREGWNIVALDFGLDLSTPQGELVANVLMSVAQWERRMIGVRTSEGMQAKKAQGARFGKPPVPAHAVDRARELLQSVSPAEAYRVLKSENMPIGRTAVYGLNR